MRNSGLIVYLVTFLLLSSLTTAYTITPDKEVHQHLAKEGGEVWPLIPYEIKDHLNGSVSTNTNWYDFDEVYYDNGDGIINGSAEEDVPVSRAFEHFFQVDNPQGGEYNDGLNIWYSNRDSSYRKAVRYWNDYVIPLYLSGKIDESYYWLGRVAHLLEDAAQPSHLHLDCHVGNPGINWIAACGGSSGDGGADDSVLEEYTGNNFQTLQQGSNWHGNNFTSKQYNYENLPNMDGFNWAEVEPTDATAKRNIELFRLFWYTAQKTQYFASDDFDGNSVYYTTDGTQKSFSTSLWSGDGVTIIDKKDYLAQDDISDSGRNISLEANATIPHAMKAVAGLYRLFEDAVRIDWPTENHDYRRTGFTLLKGDMPNANAVEKMSFVLESGGIDETEQVVKATVADLDNNGAMDTVSLVHKTSSVNETKIYAVEMEKKKNLLSKGYTTKVDRKWSTTAQGGAIYFPATLANIDPDSQKELVTGVRNGTVYAYDISSNGKSVSKRWNYYLPQKLSPLGGINITRFDGGTAVVDIDLDGNNEIVFADVFEGDSSWPGEVYVLKDNGAGNTPTKFANKTFGNGGAYATVSIANIDSDDNPEIIVPSLYGIYVFDYDPSVSGKLNTKWSNSDGKIESSAVIADVDNDNQYEIVYTTSTAGCAAGKTCYNRTYVRDAKTGTLERQIDLTTLPRPTPTVANLDSDANMEIVVLTQDSVSSSAVYGDVYCYDAVTGSACSGSWPYNDGNKLKTSFMSPNIADIDNNGNNDVVFAENNGNRVFILNNDGTKLFNYQFEGFVDNGIAIADVDQDSVAELALKRAGSPVTLFTTVSATNLAPALEKVENITAIVGDLINITLEAGVEGSDPNNNNINISYSAPFNDSGLWQTTVNDTGNYTLLVEVSDGNLTDYKFIDLILFNQNTSVVNTFSDNSTQKELNYLSPGNQTIQIRIPKNATVIYTKLTLNGKTS